MKSFLRKIQNIFSSSDRNKEQTTAELPNNKKERNYNEYIEKAIQAIQEARTEKALDIIDGFVRLTDESIQNEYLILCARFNGWKRKTILGTISKEDEIIQINRINESLLLFINILKKNQKNLFKIIGVESNLIFKLSPRRLPKEIELVLRSESKGIDTRILVLDTTLIFELQERLISEFEIDIDPAKNYDSTIIHLLINNKRVNYKRFRLSLVEAGVNHNDIIKIEIESTKIKSNTRSYQTNGPKMISILLSVKGHNFKAPTVIMNDEIIGHLHSLADDYLEVSFYIKLNKLSTRARKSKFRIIDTNSCIDFKHKLQHGDNLVEL